MDLDCPDACKSCPRSPKSYVRLWMWINPSNPTCYGLRRPNPSQPQNHMLNYRFHPKSLNRDASLWVWTGPDIGLWGCGAVKKIDFRHLDPSKLICLHQSLRISGCPSFKKRQTMTITSVRYAVKGCLACGSESERAIAVA